MTTITLTDAQRIAQQAAELLWACATCEDHAVARFDSGIYRAAELAFSTAAITAYGLSAEEAAEVRDLLAEYGPDDAMTGTTGRGIYSYAQLARERVLTRHAEAAEAWATGAEPWQDGDADVHWLASHAGPPAVTCGAWLAPRQVGAWAVALGEGWTVQLAPAFSGVTADDARLARTGSSACDR